MIIRDLELGIRDWGLGIRDWELGICVLGFGFRECDIYYLWN